ncbi:MAG: ATP-binding cassette domain-containing protein, partial [Planctomycetota bacterium]|nr:ATP-binding cassette domain-containing protein [Planctomycetota bacterium]
MIEIRDLTKLYGDFRALDGVSFDVEQGQIVAFLGPNGAGKSTTLKILTGYLTPNAGTA